MSHDSFDKIRSRLLAGEALFFLQTHEEQRWLKALQGMSVDLGYQLIDWSITQGGRGAVEIAPQSPLEFLEEIDKLPEKSWIVLKDFHPYLKDPEIIRQLRDLAESLPRKQQSLLLMGPTGQIPLELTRVATHMTLPLPSLSELIEELHSVIREFAFVRQRT